MKKVVDLPPNFLTSAPGTSIIEGILEEQIQEEPVEEKESEVIEAAGRVEVRYQVEYISLDPTVAPPQTKYGKEAFDAAGTFNELPETYKATDENGAKWFIKKITPRSHTETFGDTDLVIHTIRIELVPVEPSKRPADIDANSYNVYFFKVLPTDHPAQRNELPDLYGKAAYDEWAADISAGKAVGSRIVDSMGVVWVVMRAVIRREVGPYEKRIDVDLFPFVPGLDEPTQHIDTEGPAEEIDVRAHAQALFCRAMLEAKIEGGLKRAIWTLFVDSFTPEQLVTARKEILTAIQTEEADLHSRKSKLLNLEFPR